MRTTYLPQHLIYQNSKGLLSSVLKDIDVDLDTYVDIDVDLDIMILIR